MKTSPISSFTRRWSTARFTAEAAYVLRLLQFTDVNLSSIDDGSYIKLTYWFDRNHAADGGKTNIALTVFPLNADRMRLGYSYRISWGGSPIFFKFNPDLPVGAAPFVTNTNPAPGAKLQLSGERYYAYVGFKTSMLLNRNPQVNEQVAVYGALAGAGVDVMPQPPAHRGQRRLLRSRHQPAVLRHHGRSDGADLHRLSGRDATAARCRSRRSRASRPRSRPTSSST